MFVILSCGNADYLFFFSFSFFTEIKDTKFCAMFRCADTHLFLTFSDHQGSRASCQCSSAHTYSTTRCCGSLRDAGTLPCQIL